MRDRRKPRKTQTYDTYLIERQELTQEIQRDHRPVIEFCLPLAECPGRDFPFFADGCDLLHEFFVVIDVNCDFRRAERPEVAVCGFPRRDLEIIGIALRMRA